MKWFNRYKLLLIMIMAFSCVSMFIYAITGADTWRESLYHNYWRSQSEDAKYAAGVGVLRVRNNEGATISRGQPVELDGTAITVVANAHTTDTHTIANDLSAESGVFWLTFKTKGDTAGHVTITGYDNDDHYVTEDFFITDVPSTTNTYVCGNLWSKVTAVDSTDIKTTATVNITVTAYPYMTVNLTDNANDLVIGTVLCSETAVPELVGIRYLTTGSIADNAEGFIASQWRGPVQVFVDTQGSGGNVTILPGDKLTLDGAGYYLEDSSTPDALTSGIVVSPGATTTSTLIWAFIK